MKHKIHLLNRTVENGSIVPRRLLENEEAKLSIINFYC